MSVCWFVLLKRQKKTEPQLDQQLLRGPINDSGKDFYQGKVKKEGSVSDFQMEVSDFKMEVADFKMEVSDFKMRVCVCDF